MGLTHIPLLTNFVTSHSDCMPQCNIFSDFCCEWRRVVWCHWHTHHRDLCLWLHNWWKHCHHPADLLMYIWNISECCCVEPQSIHNILQRYFTKGRTHTHTHTHTHTCTHNQNNYHNIIAPFRSPLLLQHPLAHVRPCRLGLSTGHPAAPYQP